MKVNGQVEAGATTLSIDGTTLTGKLVKGDLIQIGEGMFTVTEDSVQAASNAIAGVSVSRRFPPLPTILR